jgi:UDP-3-O-[3-hydroxymyristoyl] glucosamine N-acyltransferase
LAHNSVIGKNGLLTAQFAMAGSSKIGDNFITGGNTSVTGHVEIGDNVHVAGKSGVTKSIPTAGQYGGYPLEPLQDFLKTKAAIINLKEMRKQLNALLKGSK